MWVLCVRYCLEMDPAGHPVVRQTYILLQTQLVMLSLSTSFLQNRSYATLKDSKKEMNNIKEFF